MKILYLGVQVVAWKLLLWSLDVLYLFFQGL